MKTTLLTMAGLTVGLQMFAAEALQAPLSKPVAPVGTNVVREIPPNVHVPEGNPRYYYSGIAVQAVKQNPVQLVNPAAPARYGSGEQNTVRDGKTGRGTGLKLFSFSW